MSNVPSSKSVASETTDDEINELVLKLQALLPQLHGRKNAKLSSSSILEETCSYIKRLRREVDNLSERLSQLLEGAETSDVELITRILQHQN